VSTLKDVSCPLSFPSLSASCIPWGEWLCSTTCYLPLCSMLPWAHSNGTSQPQTETMSQNKSFCLYTVFHSIICPQWWKVWLTQSGIANWFHFTGQFLLIGSSCLKWMSHLWEWQCYLWDTHLEQVRDGWKAVQSSTSPPAPLIPPFSCDLRLKLGHMSFRKNSFWGRQLLRNSHQSYKLSSYHLSQKI
jgi:hypothetical protein